MSIIMTVCSVLVHVSPRSLQKKSKQQLCQGDLSLLIMRSYHPKSQISYCSLRTKISLEEGGVCIMDDSSRIISSTATKRCRVTDVTQLVEQRGVLSSSGWSLWRCCPGDRCWEVTQRFALPPTNRLTPPP